MFDGDQSQKLIFALAFEIVVHGHRVGSVCPTLNIAILLKLSCSSVQHLLIGLQVFDAEANVCKGRVMFLLRDFGRHVGSQL